MKCELQPSLLPVQLLVPLPLHGPEQIQVQVLVQVPKPPLLLEMVLLVELVPVSEQVPVSMPDPPVDQTNPLTRSVPNPPRTLDTMVIRVFTPLEVRSNGLGVVFVIMCNFQTLQRFFCK